MSHPIVEFAQCRHLAIVGVSRARRKYGNYAYRELKARGLDVMAVHPALASVEGDACFKSLAELPRPADGVLICVQPEKAPEILRQAAAVGIRRAWLQQGAESSATAKLAAELGLDLVQGECILMYAPPVRGFHSLHRGIWRMIGRLRS
ncbi:MAG: CoA-binding protein [Polyangia bacterium]|jgi:predicted CoA-binding protein